MLRRPGIIAALIFCFLGINACITSSNHGGTGQDTTLTKDLFRFAGVQTGDSVNTRSISLHGATFSGLGDSGYIVVINSLGETRTELTIVNGAYSQTVELTNGVNVVHIYVFYLGVLNESALFNIVSTAAPALARIRLEWDQDMCDVDLYVDSPTGQTSSYSTKSINAGYLDIDDVTGFGPETFSVTALESGSFTVRVNYYSTNGQVNPVGATVKLSHNDSAWVIVGTHNFQPADADAGVSFWTLPAVLTL